MTLKTIRIELKADFDGQEKHDIMRKAAQEAAKHLRATASLIADKRQPQVAILSDDFFDGESVIPLDDDAEPIYMPEEVSEQ